MLVSIQLSPIAAVISNPRPPLNPIIAVNQAFCNLTGYPVEEIIERNCKFLAGPAIERWLTERSAGALGRPILVAILNYKRDRTPFRNVVLVAPVFDHDGGLECFLGSQVESCDGAVGPSSSRQAQAVELVKTLSPRQREVLQQIVGSFRTKQIAWRLSLSEKTVKLHRSLLLHRIGTTNIADAIRIVVEAGL